MLGLVFLAARTLFMKLCSAFLSISISESEDESCDCDRSCCAVVDEPKNSALALWVRHWPKH